jgi:hypothetical protein
MKNKRCPEEFTSDEKAWLEAWDRTNSPVADDGFEERVLSSYRRIERESQSTADECEQAICEPVYVDRSISSATTSAGCRPRMIGWLFAAALLGAAIAVAGMLVWGGSAGCRTKPLVAVLRLRTQEERIGAEPDKRADLAYDDGASDRIVSDDRKLDRASCETTAGDEHSLQRPPLRRAGRSIVRALFAGEPKPLAVTREIAIWWSAIVTVVARLARCETC